MSNWTTNSKRISFSNGLSDYGSPTPSVVVGSLETIESLSIRKAQALSYSVPCQRRVGFKCLRYSLLDNSSVTFFAKTRLRFVFRPDFPPSLTEGQVPTLQEFQEESHRRFQIFCLHLLQSVKR